MAQRMRCKAATSADSCLAFLLSGGFLPSALILFSAKNCVRQETGKKYAVKVHCSEGVAIRIGREPCTGIREDVGFSSDDQRRQRSTPVNISLRPKLTVL